MNRIRLIPLLGVAALIVAATVPSSFAAVDAKGFIVLQPYELKWQHREDGPDIAIIAGDPAKEGFYVLRARFAPGVMSRPHYHATDRHVTVISGTWWAGTGTEFNPDKTVPLGPGSYMMHPAREPHFDGAKTEEAIVEIKGIGPAPSVPVGR
jgi:hypothetical protein